MQENNQQVFQTFGTDISSEILARMVATKANATGKTARSLRHQESENRFTMFGSEGFINEAVQYGSPKGTLVNLDKIIEWCIARGISPGRAKRIVKNIYRRGTLTVNPSHPRDIYNSIITEQRLKELYNSLTDVNLKKVLSDIINEFKK